MKFDDVMNDQRKIIFAQRLEILQNKDIKDMIISFMNEINNNLELAHQNFAKTNNLKTFSNEIKTNYGNAFDEKNIEKFSKMKTKEMSKHFVNSFQEKRNERVKVLGENQNNEIEKRVFLQILDFLWRSHLQYLEQLRQVIGLRSYGQKDPLAEFRREAFQLFESLLFKIKTETLKFLINTNVVVENRNDPPKQKTFVKKTKISRNDPCSCGSGKKYKHCHGRVA